MHIEHDEYVIPDVTLARMSEELLKLGLDISDTSALEPSTLEPVGEFNVATSDPVPDYLSAASLASIPSSDNNAMPPIVSASPPSSVAVMLIDLIDPPLETWGHVPCAMEQQQYALTMSTAGTPQSIVNEGRVQITRLPPQDSESFASSDVDIESCPTEDVPRRAPFNVALRAHGHGDDAPEEESKQASPPQLFAPHVPFFARPAHAPGATRITMVPTNLVSESSARLDGNENSCVDKEL
jgi:hypothetical protein